MIKMEKLMKKIYLASFIMFMAFFSSSLQHVQAYGDWSDNPDDLRCFTRAQIEAFGIILEDADPTNADDLIEQIDNYWEVGTWSATPDCIDMIRVQITELGDWATLTITVQGNIKDCSTVAFYVYGNCTGTPWGMRILYDDGGLGGSVTSIYQYVDQDGNEHSGTPEISGSDISVEYPNVENCGFHILALTYNTHSEILCADKFPDPSSSGGAEEGSSITPGTSFSGWDPITIFFEFVAGLFLGILCGRLPYLTLMAMFLTLSKALIDRKSKIASYIGFAFSLICFWSIFWYSIDINFLAEDPLLTFSPLAIVDFITCFLFMGFLLLTYANWQGFTDDNEWTFFMAFALIFIESIVFMTPDYFYYCAGQPTLSLIIELIFLMIFIAVFYMTEKLSKGRLK